MTNLFRKTGGVLVPVGTAGEPDALDDLVDVDAANPVDGQELTWDANAAMWVPGPPDALDDLVDVDAANPVDGQQLTWDANAAMWVPGPVVDARGKFKISSGIGYPGTNQPIQFDAYDYVTADCPTLSAGTFNVTKEGLYSIHAQVAWGGSSAPAVCAAWLYIVTTEGGFRYQSAETTSSPPANVSAGSTNSSTTVRMVPGNWFQVQVYNPSGAPPGLNSAEIVIASLGS